MTYAIKALISVVIILGAAEIAKRSSLLGAFIVALPLTSMVAMGMLYYDTRNTQKVAEFARAIPLMVLPTFLFFYAFSFLVDRGATFVMAMVLATLLMLAGYALTVFFLARTGL